MFKINFRIVDDFQELRDMDTRHFDVEWGQIEGFIQICFGEHEEGYYHEYSLGEDETGDELLDYWFDKLLDTVEMLDTRTKYVAFREIETVNKWLEFKREGENVIVNVALENAVENEALENFVVKKDIIITENSNGFLYISPVNTVVSLYELEQETINQAGRFLEELGKLNPQLLNTEMALKLAEKMRKCKELLWQ